MPVILVTQEAEVRRIKVCPGKEFPRPCFEKSFIKIGLVEWLHDKAMLYPDQNTLWPCFLSFSSDDYPSA
jgi:hypothetical protein